MKKKCSNKYF